MPDKLNLPERVNVALNLKELQALQDFWLNESRAYEKIGDKEKAGQAFERSCRMADLRHEVL